MDAATLERLGTAGLLAALLLAILYMREKQFQKERAEWREDLNSMIALTRTAHSEVIEVMQDFTTEFHSLKGWLEGKIQ